MRERQKARALKNNLVPGSFGHWVEEVRTLSEVSTISTKDQKICTQKMIQMFTKQEKSHSIFTRQEHLAEIKL